MIADEELKMLLNANTVKVSSYNNKNDIINRVI